VGISRYFDYLWFFIIHAISPLHYCKQSGVDCMISAIEGISPKILVRMHLWLSAFRVWLLHSMQNTATLASESQLSGILLIGDNYTTSMWKSDIDYLWEIQANILVSSSVLYFSILLNFFLVKINITQSVTMQLLFIYSTFSLHVSLTIDHPQVFSFESFHTALVGIPCCV
jgi:hypothetical protein